MKIGIVGLLHDQARQLRQRYPDHDLHFLDRDREKDVGTFQQGMAKVVITTKFTGHGSTYAVPGHKRVLGLNSISAIGRWLDTLPKPGAPVPAVRETPHTLIRLDFSDEVSWATYFDGVQPTDVLRFEYDTHKVDLHRVRRSISNARSYQAKHHQILTKMKHGKGTGTIVYTDVAILSVAGETRKPEPAELLAEAIPTEAPLEPVTLADAEFEAECRQLYRDALVARAGLPHGSVEQAAADAARAVDCYRRAFPRKPA